MRLRFITYLAPSLPEAWFALLAAELEAALGATVALEFERSISGPLDDSEDPFGRGEAELGFVCAPSFRWLRRDHPGLVHLLPLPVPEDPRADGRPVYFSDVIVAAGCAAQTARDLRSARWAFNDTHSLSGFGVLRDRLGEDGFATARLLHSGSHLASIDLVASGGADAAAIDSNVLRLALRSNPPQASTIRVLESWGPRPIQAAIIHSSVDASLRGRIGKTLLTLHERKSAELRTYGFERFVTVADDFYDETPVPPPGSETALGPRPALNS